MQLAATEQNFAQGNSQYTGRTSDLLINGDGFFQVSNQGQLNYTRAGSFTFSVTKGPGLSSACGWARVRTDWARLPTEWAKSSGH